MSIQPDIMQENINERNNNEENTNERNISEENTSERNINRGWRNFIIHFIIAIFAIIAMFFMLRHSKRPFINFNVDDFIKFVERLGIDLDIFKLPSNEVIDQNIINCTSLAHRVEESVAFNSTGSELVERLHEFSSQLEIAKSSYAKMFTDGALFIWNFEQFINETLNYVSNESFMSTIHRKINNNLQSSIKGSVETLNEFLSSVEKAYEATVTAESFRSKTHKQVIKAKKEVQNFISNSINPSPWDKIRNFIDSIFDKTKENNLAIEVKIATSIEEFLDKLDNDLGRVAGVLLDFKSNLEELSRLLLQLEANVKFLKESKWNEHDIKRIKELLNMIKENHKKFKSRVVNQ